MLLFLLTACGPPSHGSGSLDADYALGELVPNVVEVRWVVPEAGQACVEWGLTEDMSNRTPYRTVTADEDFLALVLGPPSGEQVYFRAVQVLPDGTRLEGPTQTLNIPLEPADMPAVYVDGAPGGPGYLLTSLIGQTSTYVVILDGDARPVWYYRTDSNQLVTAEEPAQDGMGILIMSDVVADGGGSSVLAEIAWTGQTTWSMKLPGGHHDFAELPGGRIAWIQQELGEGVIDGELVSVAGDAVRISSRADVADTSGAPMFSLLRDTPGPEALCHHQEHTIAVGGEQAVDWSHANSLSYDPLRDALLLFTHHVDRVRVIRASDGALLRDVGFDDGSLEDDEGDPWSHGHASEMNEDRLLIFDNGLHYDPPRSRVVLYNLVPGSEELQLEMEYWEPEARVVQALGDAITLPWKNTLISWSTLGTVSEINQDAEEVWSLHTGIGAGIGRLGWLDHLP